MSQKLNAKHSYNKFKKHSLISSSIEQNEDKNLKPAGEWIYGTLSQSVNNKTKNFKNQSAFKGYQKNRYDLYKSIY